MKQKDFEVQYGAVIAGARLYWNSLVLSTLDQYGDKGSAVLGDGIVVQLIPPRCKKPRDVMVIPSSCVKKAIGSLHYEVHAKDVVEFLKERGVNARYHYGMMD